MGNRSVRAPFSLPIFSVSVPFPAVNVAPTLLRVASSALLEMLGRSWVSVLPDLWDTWEIQSRSCPAHLIYSFLTASFNFPGHASPSKGENFSKAFSWPQQECRKSPCGVRVTEEMVLFGGLHSIGRNGEKNPSRSCIALGWDPRG